MERYDGKTKKDDYIKYGLIAAAVILVIVGLCVFSSFLKHRNQKEPDFTVVVGAKTPFNQSMTEDLRSVLEHIVEDRNGDGEVVVDVEVLRLVDVSTAALDLDNESSEKVAAVTSGDDFQRMQFYLADGEHSLFLLTDEPSGDFQGAVSAYCKEEYFQELPEDLGNAFDGRAVDLSGAPFVSELGLEDVPIYGCVLDGKGEGPRYAVDVLRQLAQAHVTMWETPGGRRILFRGRIKS